jgi:hypothetical protein
VGAGPRLALPADLEELNSRTFFRCNFDPPLALGGEA